MKKLLLTIIALTFTGLTVAALKTLHHNNAKDSLVGSNIEICDKGANTDAKHHFFYPLPGSIMIKKCRHVQPPQTFA